MWIINKIKYLYIKLLCNAYGIGQYNISKDLLVEVFGGVNLNGSNLKKLPINFSKVHGDFLCSNNELSSLIGAPKYVMGRFSCSNNNLSKLNGSPEYVGDNFDCSHNLLETLIGGPSIVKGDYNCFCNKLKTLEGICDEVKVIKFSDNKITTLYYFPLLFEKAYVNCIASNPLDSRLRELKFSKSGYLYGSGFSLPLEFWDSYMGRKKEKEKSVNIFDHIYDLNDILQNQKKYGVWNKNGSLNYNRLLLLMEDIMNNNIC